MTKSDKILSFIRKFIDEHGAPPNSLHIARELHIHGNAARALISKLRKDGVLTNDPWPDYKIVERKRASPLRESLVAMRTELNEKLNAIDVLLRSES